MKRLTWPVLAIALVAAYGAGADNLNGDAEQCYAETEKAVEGAAPDSLSTAPCRRALRFELISRADRSAMLHNRGIILNAKVDLEGAKTSFAQAVRLSTTVDKRNLALAQVAQKLGDTELAIEQYELLRDSGLAEEDPAAYATVLNNLAVATAALADGRIAAAD